MQPQLYLPLWPEILIKTSLNMGLSRPLFDLFVSHTTIHSEQWNISACFDQVASSQHGDHCLFLLTYCQRCRTCSSIWYFVLSLYVGGWQTFFEECTGLIENCSEDVGCRGISLFQSIGLHHCYSKEKEVKHTLWFLEVIARMLGSVKYNFVLDRKWCTIGLC